MSRLAIVALAGVLSACASARPRTLAAPPSPAATACPQYVVNGVVQFSSCESANVESAKCDAMSPSYVANGVVVGCAKTEEGR